MLVWKTHTADSFLTFLSRTCSVGSFLSHMKFCHKFALSTIKAGPTWEDNWVEFAPLDNCGGVPESKLVGGDYLLKWSCVSGLHTVCDLSVIRNCIKQKPTERADWEVSPTGCCILISLFALACNSLFETELNLISKFPSSSVQNIHGILILQWLNSLFSPFLYVQNMSDTGSTGWWPQGTSVLLLFFSQVWFVSSCVSTDSLVCVCVCVCVLIIKILKISQIYCYVFDLVAFKIS